MRSFLFQCLALKVSVALRGMEGQIVFGGKKIESIKVCVCCELIQKTTVEKTHAQCGYSFPEAEFEGFL